MSLLILSSPENDAHDTGPLHPEHPGRIAAVLDGVARAGMRDQVEVPAEHPGTSAAIVRTHAPELAAELEEAIERGEPFFHVPDNPLSSGTARAARAAVSTALTAADALWREKRARRAFVVARPPGHHAERATAMGFCFFNTIACVADALRTIEGIDRVFILDWDVHHGNGTQHLFESREDIYYASLHRYPFYPGTGAAQERGVGPGEGCTRNVPLPAGTGDTHWLREFDRVIVPEIDRYRPNAVLISAGFDAHRRDPLGGMELTEQAYGEMTQRLVALADRHADGRLLSLLEGGYDMEGLARSVQQHVAAMSEE